VTPRNPLAESGKPLFFRVEPTSAAQLSPPAPRSSQALRVHVRSLSAMQKEALVVSTESAAVWRLASDEGSYLAGLDEAPCPLAFFTTGMVCATLDELIELARRRGITLAGVRLVQDNFYTMTGSAVRGTMRGGARNVRLLAQISGSADDATLGHLVRDAVATSPLHGLLARELPSLFALAHNGRSVPLGERQHALAEPVGSSHPLVATDEVFAGARPARGDWSALVRRGDRTPRMPHSVTQAGGSLTAEQNRLLHLRGICMLRGDGLKAVEVQLFNPHGSIFHFLSDAPTRLGGNGLAPDALSYAAAGVAFCFMTQFGRYASIRRLALDGYRIVQDVHLRASHATTHGAAHGSVAPIETHVSLDTGESDDIAREMLAMAEQTCFLHALCKASVATEVVVEPWSDTEVALPAGVRLGAD
jgi:uncharacterized OsmC-like protein